MTEGPYERNEPGIAAEIDIRLAAIHSQLGLGELDGARGYLRRLLMDTWYDGHSAGMNAKRNDFQGRPNPWLKGVE